MTKTWAALSCAVLLLAAAPAHAAKYKVRWYLGHPTLDYFEDAARDFKTAVEKKSHGDISVEIVVAASDESGPEIARKVEKGEIEMGHSFTDVMGAVDPRYYAFEAPYLFRGYPHQEGVFEGPLGDKMLGELRGQNLVGLSFTYSGGAQGVATVDREIRSPADMKGLKVGVYGDPANAAWLEALGAEPVAIGHDLGRVLTLQRQGKLDAIAITWRNLERDGLERAFRRFNLPGSTYLVSVTYANAKFFASLPAEYRALLLDESRKAGAVERSKTIELNESAKRQELAEGVRAVALSEPGRRAFVEALKPVYDGPYARLLGQGFLESVRQTPDRLERAPVPNKLARR